MKQKISLLFALMLSTLMASADVININNIYYNLDFSTKTAEVTSNPNNYSGSVYIPASVTFKGLEYNVTSIGESAFPDCSELTSVTIPNSVTSIGAWAFNGCSGLTSIIIPNSVTRIGGGAFSDCSGLTAIIVESGNSKYDSRNTCNAIIETESNTLIAGCKNTTIPNSVTSIGDNAFSRCSGLTSIEIPNSVTSIGRLAFKNCSGLTSLTIGNSVTSIGEWAFYGCSGLTSITIPNSVTSIGGQAFGSCSGLTFVTIPNSVTNIGDGAFSVCSGLTSIEIPNSVTTIGGHAFSGCSGLTSVTIPNSVTSIGEYAFNGCRGLTSIEIPNSVTSIGGSAFYGCSGLTSVTIGNSVTSIGNEAFRSCSGLTSVTIGNSVTSIGSYAFEYCKGLTSVTIGNSVTSIGNSAFQNCSRLTSVTIPNSVTSIGSSAFYGCSGLTSVAIGNSVTSIGSNAFDSCSRLTSVTIPNSVTSIGNAAFYNCSGLTSVTIGNSVTSIGYAAFSGCSGLISVHITDIAAWCKIDFYSYSSPLYYAKHLFMDGKEITDLVIPNSVTSIGHWAFSGCSGLTSVTIPNSVTSIGAGAFFECSGITSVKSEISVPFTFGSNAFNGISSNCVLAVPYGTKDAYITNGWTKSVFQGGIKEFMPVVDGIYYYFNSNNKQATVTAGENKYSGNVIIPSSVTFNGTEYSVTCIGDSAFYSCDGLTSVTIPNSVTSIGNAAFANCIELAEVYCYAEQIPTTGNDVFKDSYINYVTLHVPASAVNAYKTTAPWREFGSIVALPEPTLRGDANGDGKVDMDDATFVTNIILGTEDATEAADVNKDGEINMPDVMFIINYIKNGKFPELEKAGVRFGFYEDIPGYSFKINKLNVSGLIASEFGSVGTTLKESNSNLTYDKPDGSFTNVIFKDANENPQMVVEVDYTLTSDKGNGDTFTGKAINNISLQDITQWEPNKNYTFIFKVIPTYLYILNDYDYRNPTFYIENVIVEGQDGSTR